MTAIRQRVLRAEDFPAEHREWLDPLLRSVNELNGDAAGILNGGLSLSSNANAFVAEFTATAVADEWIYPTLTNGWVNYGSPYQTIRYCRRDGTVYLEGVIKSGTNYVIFCQLSEGYRPDATINFACSGGLSDSGLHRISVDSAGNVGIGYTTNTLVSVRVTFRSTSSAGATQTSGAVTPVLLKNSLRSGDPPSGIVILSATDVTSSNHFPVSVAACPAWKMSGKNIAITGIYGVASLRRYRVKALVLG